MKGDFTRETFAPESHYASVRLQQGRVLLDADWNEQADIAGHRVEAETTDVVGPCGAPMHDAAFGVFTTIASVPDAAERALLNTLLASGLGAGDFILGPGRFYADGILCENEHYVPYTLQPDRVGTPALDVSTAGTQYLLYLDVWRRHITALDDPRLREAALGGPDTATRARTIWQVRALAAGTGDFHCPDALAAYDDATAPSTGTLRAQAVPESPSDAPCIVPPSAGYTGLENQLYRIEIHDPGKGIDPGTGGGTALNSFPAVDQVEYAGGTWNVGDIVEIYASAASADPMNGQLAVVTAKLSGKKLTLNRTITALAPELLPRLRKVGATFKWSRDNGIVVSAITAVSGTDVTVESLGVDAVLDFEPGQWVEITDRARELEGTAGVLAQVDAVLPASRVVRLHGAPTWPGDLATVDPARGLRLRRWDGIGAVKYRPGASGPGWIGLESGVQVAFDAGSYHTGDYWQVPARTASADARSGRVEWPTDAANHALARSPFGIVHHYCRLAVLTVGASGALSWHDCRDLFPPLTEMTRLFHVGGDGQEAMPHAMIPKPLEAGVFNGETPVAGVWVRFQPTWNGQVGVATVDPNTGDPTVATWKAAGASVDVQTSADGVAACGWLPDPDVTHPSQRVSATLLDDALAATEQVIHFDGNLSIADQVWYDPGACEALGGQGTVQKAIARLADLPSLYWVAGGGEIVKPGESIAPLVVRAASACGPVTQGKVSFKVTAGSGTLTGGGSSGPEVTVDLDTTGEATCTWSLDTTTHDQEVVATLIGTTVPPAEPTRVRFTAALSAAVYVAYDPTHCPDMAQAGVKDVQAALDYLCSHGGGCCKPVAPGSGTLAEAIKQALEKGDCCLCLRRGEYVIEGGLEIAGGGPLRIQGCGPYSVIRILGAPVTLQKLPYLELRDLAVQSLGVDAPLRLVGCESIVVSGCRMQVNDNAPTLLSIGGSRTVRLAASGFRAFTDLATPGGIASGLKVNALPDYATVADVRSYLDQTATAMVSAKKAQRTALSRSLNDFADATGTAPALATRMRAVADALAASAPKATDVQPVLAAALLGRAIVLQDAGALATIEDCEIAGEVRIFGDDGDLPAALLKNIIAAHAQNLSLTPGSGELVLRGNRLMRLSTDGQLQHFIDTPQNQPIVIREIHSRAMLGENEFALPNSFLVAGSTAVTSNSFINAGSLLTVLADVATAVGNVSPRDSTMHLYPTQAAQQAGNIMNVSVT